MLPDAFGVCNTFAQADLAVGFVVCVVSGVIAASSGKG